MGHQFEVKIVHTPTPAAEVIELFLARHEAVFIRPADEVHRDRLPVEGHASIIAAATLAGGWAGPDVAGTQLRRQPLRRRHDLDARHDLLADGLAPAGQLNRSRGLAA